MYPRYKIFQGLISTTMYKNIFVYIIQVKFTSGTRPNNETYRNIILSSGCFANSIKALQGSLFHTLRVIIQVNLRIFVFVFGGFANLKGGGQLHASLKFEKM
jgi:hypothetical protein